MAEGLFAAGFEPGHLCRTVSAVVARLLGFTSTPVVNPPNGV